MLLANMYVNSQHKKVRSDKKSDLCIKVCDVSIECGNKRGNTKPTVMDFSESYIILADDMEDVDVGDVR